jgi:hypothetical protein
MQKISRQDLRSLISEMSEYREMSMDEVLRNLSEGVSELAREAINSGADVERVITTVLDTLSGVDRDRFPIDDVIRHTENWASKTTEFQYE